MRQADGRSEEGEKGRRASNEVREGERSHGGKSISAQRFSEEVWQKRNPHEEREQGDSSGDEKEYESNVLEENEVDVVKSLGTNRRW
jgi:hypothetical protein